MFSLPILTQSPIPRRSQVRSRLCLLRSLPCFSPANTHSAPRVRLWNDHPDSLHAVQHATARAPKGENDKTSCEASGSGCDGGFFCNHPTGDGGTCVMCPVEEASCEDFDEAVGACEHNCFKREADEAPVLDVGTAYDWSWCPRGGCCVDDNGQRYACGCGWFQERIKAPTPSFFFPSESCVNCVLSCDPWYSKNCQLRNGRTWVYEECGY